MNMKPRPGAYRELFKAGLLELIAQGKLNKQQRSEAMYYLRLLDDPHYKFGTFQSGGGYTDFFRS